MFSRCMSDLLYYIYQNQIIKYMNHLYGFATTYVVTYFCKIGRKQVTMNLLDLI